MLDTNTPIIITFIFCPNFTTYLNQIIREFKFKSNLDDLKAFSDVHQSKYVTALKIYKDNKIFGSGTKTFRHLCERPEYHTPPLGCSTHPHNTYIQLLSETGLIGFFLTVINNHANF